MAAAPPMRLSPWLCGAAAGALVACGGAPPVPAPTWAEVGWTPTPLDALLPRASPGGCRVDVRRADLGEVTETRYWVAPDGRVRARITRRPDGAVSARVEIERDAARLDVLLELEPASELGDAAILALIADPAHATVSSRFHLSRSWTERAGGEVVTRDEHGERAPAVRSERHERDGGRAMWARSTAGPTRARAVQEGRTRRSSYVAPGRGPDDASVTQRTEVLDDAGYTVEERVERAGRTSRTALQYDGEGALSRIETDGVPVLRLFHDRDGTVVASSSCARRVRATPDGEGLERGCDGWFVWYDASGRPSHGWHPESDGRFRVERDASGRVAVYRETSEELTALVALERDESGRAIREETTWESASRGWRRVLERRWDERGRLVRSTVASARRRGPGTTPEPRVESVVELTYAQECEAQAVDLPPLPGHDSLAEAPLGSVPSRWSLFDPRVEGMSESVGGW